MKNLIERFQGPIEKHSPTVIKILLVAYVFIALTHQLPKTLVLLDWNIPAISYTGYIRELANLGLLCIFFLFVKNKFKIPIIIYLVALFVISYSSHLTFMLSVCGILVFFPSFIYLSPKNSNSLKYLPDLIWIKNFVVCLFLINVGLQTIQLVWGNGFYARILDVINARNPGVFFYPSPGALLSLSCVLVFIQITKKWDFKKHIVLALSIGLTASLSGLISIFALSLAFKKYFVSKAAFIYSMALNALLIPYIHLARYSMTGSTYLKETAGGRLDLFSNVATGPNVFDINMFGTAIKFPDLSLKYFGYYTNYAYSLYPDKARLADSTYTSLMGNLGFNHLVLLVLFCLILLWKEFFKRYKYDLLLSGLFCYGINISEIPIVTMILILSSIITVANRQKETIIS